MSIFSSNEVISSSKEMKHAPIATPVARTGRILLVATPHVLPFGVKRDSVPSGTRRRQLQGNLQVAPSVGMKVFDIFVEAVHTS